MSGIYKILLIDKEPENRYFLEEMLEKSQICAQLTSFSTVLEAEKQVKLCEYQLYIISTDDHFDMAIHFAKRVHGEEGSFFSPIVFLSRRIDYIITCYQQGGCLDFIQKPLTYENTANLRKLLRCHMSVLRKINYYTPHYLWVENCGVNEKISPDDILFMETSDRKCVIHTENKDIYCTQSLKQLANDLCSPTFIQVHRSYIVNASKIYAINKNLDPWSISFVGTRKTAPISRSKRKLLIETLNIK